MNLDFARANIKSNIYDQAIPEGVATTFPQTEDIIDNDQVHGMTATDVRKTLNLKHAWEFILDKVQRRSHVFVQNQVPSIAITSEYTPELMKTVTRTSEDTPDLIDVHKIVEIASALDGLVRTL